jgi:hypothetical protein
MAVRKNALEEDNILCVLYSDIRTDVSDYSANESLDSDSVSDVPTSSRKQLQSSLIVVTSDSETSTIEEESSEPENSEDKTRNVWCKTDKKKNKQ